MALLTVCHIVIDKTNGCIDSLWTVADKVAELPPDCGPFPIYSVAQYKSELPEHMAEKGGLFVPIYGKHTSTCPA